MNDLLLDPLTHDLRVSGLDLGIVEGADRVRQNLIVKLRLWVGEWFLDPEFGTPYREEILGKRLSLSGSIAAIKLAILEVADTDEITAFRYNFSRSERKLYIDFEVSTPFGLIGISL